MKVRVRIVMMSHLSDVQDRAILGGNPQIQSEKIDFVRWLLLKFPNTNTKIDADAEYELYQKSCK